MARRAIFTGRLFHGTTAFVFEMAGRAGMITHDVRLMKLVFAVATEAVHVDGGHLGLGDAGELPNLQRPWVGRQRNMNPACRSGIPRGMATRAGVVAAEVRPLQFGESPAAVVRRDFSRRNEFPAIWPVKS